MRIAAILLLFLSSLAWAAPGKGALDKATFENYLRHVELFRGDVTFKLDDPRHPSTCRASRKCLVHLIFNAAEKDELFYISSDGQTIIRGDVFNLGKSPFQSNLDKLTLTDQPSFGPADAPVTIVEFGDFECPDCKMEAPILRHDLTEKYRRKGAGLLQEFPTRIRASLGSRGRHRRTLRGINRDNPRSGNSTIGFTRTRIRSRPIISTPRSLAWAGDNGVDTREIGPMHRHQSHRT